MGKLSKFLEDITPAVPIVGGVISNILSGMNTRKARIYDSPKNQIARMREAGLPTSAGSHITGGGGFTTSTQPLGTDNYASNIGSSIQRQIGRKQIDLLKEQIRSAKQAADFATQENQYRNSPFLGDPNRNNYFASQDFNLSLQQSNDAIRRNDYTISAIDTMFKNDLWKDGKQRELFDRQLDQLIMSLKSSGLSQQLAELNITNENEMTKVRQDFINKMESGMFPNLSSIIYALAFGTTRLNDFKY